MPSVNYYLKKPDNQSAAALIYLQFKYNGRKLVYSFGQKINPLDWSRDRKRVKSNRETILNGQYALNELLDELESTCLSVYQEELMRGIPPVNVLQFRLNSFIKQKQGVKEDPALYLLFDRFISGEIKYQHRSKSPNTLKNYATTKNHLLQYALHHRSHCCFEHINLDFFTKYTVFLKDVLQLSPNSIAKDISVIKTVMSFAVDEGFTTNIQWRHRQFSYVAEKAEAVCLSPGEINQLASLDLSTAKRLERVRDLFVIAALTGRTIAQCAGALARNFAPASQPALEAILQRYESQQKALPASPSNQKLNKYIKEVCQMAGLTEKGRKASAPELALWECITSVTACRSYASIAFKAGMPARELMKITGHRSETSLLRFIREE